MNLGFDLLTESEQILLLLKERRLAMIQMKARCLIEYFRVSLILLLGQDEEIKEYMDSLEETERK